MGRWNIDDVEVDALYRLAPEDFVTARDSLSRVLRASGERAMAAQITALRRPSVAAWLVNQIVRERPDDIAELVETGAVLRETQGAVLAGRADGAQLQALTAGRRLLIDALVAAARELAQRSGRKAAPLDAVDATLVAATADEAAAQAVTTGRLVRELNYSGFGLTEDLAESFAPPLRVAPSKAARQAATSPPRTTLTSAPKTAPKTAPGTKPGSKTLPRTSAVAPVDNRRAAAAATASRAATMSVLAAQAAVQDTLGAADDAQRSYEALSHDVESAIADELRLTEELAAVRNRLTELKERHRAAKATARSAHAESERARTALMRAQQKLDRQG